MFGLLLTSLILITKQISIALGGWKYDEKQPIYLISKYVPHKIYINNKGKNSNFIVEKPGREDLNQLIKLISPVMEQIDFMCLLRRCTGEKNNPFVL